METRSNRKDGAASDTIRSLPLLTLTELKAAIHYDPETGIFVRKSKTGPNVRVGAIAGVIKNGYRFIRVLGRRYAAHRLAWFYMLGEWPVSTIDHKNGDTSDNRFENLRQATRRENSANRKLNRNSKTGYKGVTFHKASGKFRARVYAGGTVHDLGGFDRAEDAASAYDKKAAEVHGDFARTNGAFV